MPKEKKRTLEEVAAKVEAEGLGYCITDYMRGDSIKDATLAELWDKAAELFNAINDILEPYYE